MSRRSGRAHELAYDPADRPEPRASGIDRHDQETDGEGSGPVPAPPPNAPQRDAAHA
jgi:hypothetical protein